MVESCGISVATAQIAGPIGGRSMAGYSSTFSAKRLWIILTAGMIVMFGVLLFLGSEVYQQAPPIPDSVRSASGDVLYTKAEIERGQNTWQSMGGMQQGSIWGHGGYLAPDWSADWLHREASALLDIISQRDSNLSLPESQKQAMHQAVLSAEMRANTYDPSDGSVTVSDERARAIREVEAHFTDRKSTRLNSSH